MGKYKCIVFWMFLNGAAFFNYFAAAQCFHEKTLVKWVLNGLEIIREKLNRVEEDEDRSTYGRYRCQQWAFFRVL